jgi:hypothetical protein
MVSSIKGLNGALPDQQIDLASASKIAGNRVPGFTTQLAPTPPPALEVTDTTDLSALSAILARAVEAASAQSTIRPPLIDSIRAQIAAGVYGPELSSVAEAIVRALSVG